MSELGNQRRLNILFVSPEAVPFAKTGGLGDVAGALPQELLRLGHDVRLFMPRYSTIDGNMFGFQEWGRLAVPSSKGSIDAVIEHAAPPKAPVPVYALRYDPYFDRAGLYQQDGVDYADNLERFAFFSRAAVEFLLHLARLEGWKPDLFHAHDWQSSLSVVYMRALYDTYPPCRNAGTLLTIHNLSFQGTFPASDYSKTGLKAGLFTPQALEFFGSLNLLKGGLVFADFLNTVSPSYSHEIQTPESGCGLDGILVGRRERLTGVLNGIDTVLWNPAQDPHVLPNAYSLSDQRGKQQCKTSLQQELGLPSKEAPLLAMVSRLTSQKGIDLVAEILPELMELDVQIVILGKGEARYEEWLRALHGRYPSKLIVRIGFDEGLAHRIYAGADMFLMPSRYEPCGLSQLISFRYGTVPIVRRTGGLADTVVPYFPRAVSEGRANGFMFSPATTEALLTTILLALRVYASRDEWKVLMRAGMHVNVSWERSARSYVELYERILKERSAPPPPSA